jgi:hypothetical protein
MLVLPETFTEQTPRAAAFHRAANFAARDNAQSRRRPVRQAMPVGDETAKRQTLALLPHAREIAVLSEARGAGKPQAFRCIGGHGRAS